MTTLPLSEPCVSLLTGITDADLHGAPRFKDIAGELAAFIGKSPLVGQNVSFDLAFLAAKGIRPGGPVYDTRDLSRLVRPDAPDHSLAALTAALEVTNDSPHRALADAETTMRVFQRLCDRLMSLEPETLAGVLSLALRAGDTWPLGNLVREAARRRGLAPAAALDVVRAAIRRLGPVEPTPSLLAPRLIREAVAIEEIAALFGPEGRLARSLPEYEPRPQQMTMAGRVAQALDGGETLLIEAPAGTGKSLAYLTPALLFAKANGTPVAVATSTKGLQEQLATKDLQTALQAAGLDPEDVPVAVLKGRGNYLCLTRLAAALEREDLATVDIPFLARVLVWLESTQRGDMGELSLSQDESVLWSTLSAGTEEERVPCRYQREGTCFLARARREAQGAYLVITNHSLLLADSMREGGVLSHVKHLIIDEAHHLEREATEQYGQRVTQREVEELLAALGAATGRPRLLTGAMARAAASGATALLESIAQRGTAVGEAAASCLQRARDLYQHIGALAAREAIGPSDAEVRLRLTAAVRATQEWKNIADLWKELDLSLANAARTLGALRDALEGAAGQDAVRQADDLTRRLSEVRARLETTIAQPGAGGIVWTSRPPAGREGIGLHWAPLSAGDLLRTGLFQGRDAIVLASATLTTGGSFAYLRERLGLDRPGELLLDSPFDYKTAAAVFVPSDMPEPDGGGYARAVERTITGLAPVAGGGVLVLFTSHSALRQAYTAVRSGLQAHGITVMAQGIDGPPARLAELLRRQPKSVLLGAATFWEGVDLAAEALRLLIIVRLPFAVPSDPITAARGEAYADPFRQFTLPESLLRFRQGLGRLIRSGRDHGAIVILDARVLTRGYGASFLGALPPTNLSTPTLSQLPHEVGDWLQGKDGAQL